MSYATDVFVPLSALNDAQRATLGAAGALLQGPGVDGLNLTRTTVSEGLTPMPDGVFSLCARRTDGASAPTVFLHPDGSLRLNYAPASR